MYTHLLLFLARLGSASLKLFGQEERPPPSSLFFLDRPGSASLKLFGQEKRSPPFPSSWFFLARLGSASLKLFGQEKRPLIQILSVFVAHYKLQEDASGLREICEMDKTMAGKLCDLAAVCLAIQDENKLTAPSQCLHPRAWMSRTPNLSVQLR